MVDAISLGIARGSWEAGQWQDGEAAVEGFRHLSATFSERRAAVAVAGQQVPPIRLPGLAGLKSRPTATPMRAGKAWQLQRPGSEMVVQEWLRLRVASRDASQSYVGGVTGSSSSVYAPRSKEVAEAEQPGEAEKNEPKSCKRKASRPVPAKDTNLRSITRSADERPSLLTACRESMAYATWELSVARH